VRCALRIKLTVWIWLVLEITGSLPSPVRGQNKAPYGHSPVIQSADWDFKQLIRLANTPGKGGSDLWPATWAADGNVYAGWGDGGGFSGASDTVGRVSLGFARITGFPPRVKGVDVWGNYPKYAAHPATFCGKPTSMLSVDGILYAWVSSWFNESASNFVHCASNPDVPELRLAWSASLGATWTLSPWRLDELPGHLICSGFLNFGENYSGARDEFVYVYGRLQGEESTTYLARVRPADLQKDPQTSGLYEYYAGRGPLWSADASLARPVFVDPGGRHLTHVVYDAGLRRYLAAAQGHSIGETGLFDAPEPWGPWTTITYDQNWGGFGDRESLGVDFPTKWISRDGKTMWAVFSGGRIARGDDILDSLNLVKLTLILKRTAVTMPTDAPAGKHPFSAPKRARTLQIQSSPLNGRGL